MQRPAHSPKEIIVFSFISLTYFQKYPKTVPKCRYAFRKALTGVTWRNLKELSILIVLLKYNLAIKTYSVLGLCHGRLLRISRKLFCIVRVGKGKTMSPRKIIIDTDPGQDDAIAILLALASPEEIEVLGITAVAGNVPLSLTEKNARIVCELAGKPQVRVFAGCDAPLARPLITAEHVHGKTGLDGPVLPDPQMPLQAQHGVDFIVETIRSAPPKTITLCPLGPLTNIASALLKAPDIAERIEEIILMGGAYFEVGNITPSAEFNIYVDPEAADIIFKSGISLTVMPLDVTHKALVTKERNDAFRALGTAVGAATADMTDFFERFDKEKYGSAGAPLHDPCVTAYLIKPELFKGRYINVMIETESELTLGMTVADWWRVTKRPANATFMNNIDADGFFTLLTERLGRL